MAENLLLDSEKKIHEKRQYRERMLLIKSDVHVSKRYKRSTVN